MCRSTTYFETAASSSVWTYHDLSKPGPSWTHLAGVNLALQEPRTDHPVREREVVEGTACLLVYDAHGCPLQEVRLGGCQDKETTPQGHLHRDHCSVAGFTLTTTPEGGATPALQAKARRPTALQGCVEVTQGEGGGSHPRTSPLSLSGFPSTLGDLPGGYSEVSKEALTLGGPLKGITQGSPDFFHKGPQSKYVLLYRPDSLLGPLSSAFVAGKLPGAISK